MISFYVKQQIIILIDISLFKFFVNQWNKLLVWLTAFQFLSPPPSLSLFRLLLINKDIVRNVYKSNFYVVWKPQYMCS